MKKKTEELAKLRNNIISTMKSMGKDKVTADEVLSEMVNKKLVDSTMSLERIGNNLRVLKNEGCTSDEKVDNKRCWSLTGSEFKFEPPVRMVVAFPKKTHESLTKRASKESVSKTKYILDSVEERLNPPSDQNTPG